MTGKSIRILGAALLFAAGLLLLPSAALADTMTFVGVYNSAAQTGGVYDSPYVVKIDGVQTLAICDDFTQELQDSWTANEYTLSDVGVAPPAGGPQKFNTVTPANDQALVTSSANTDLPSGFAPTIQQDYEAAALLASELLSPGILNDSSNSYYWVGVYSYAIWTIFDTNAINGWNGTTPMSSASDIWKVQAAAFNTVENDGNVVNFSIYTPEPHTASQEFLVITPEASATVTLALDLLALFGVVFLVRRRALWNAGGSR